MKDIDLNDFIEEQEPQFAWYTMRILTVNEDRAVSSLFEKIKHYQLEEKIKAIEVFKEYKIEESKDYQFNSPELPIRAVKRTDTVVWVKTPFGTLRKIKIVEKRPFKGLAFVKLCFNKEIFKIIKSWDRSIYFLGDPNPEAMTDADFERMKSSIDPEQPNLDAYLKKNNYIAFIGNLSHIQPNIATVETEQESEMDQAEDAGLQQTSQITEKENIPVETAPSQEQSYGPAKAVIKDIKKLKINDCVFVIDFGTQGLIQSINLETGEIVVSIQAFGRRQPIVCFINKLREI